MTAEMRMVWTEYMRYRADLRGLDLVRIKEIVRYSTECYIDTVTGRLVVVGKHAKDLVMIPYEIDESAFRPVTAHTTTRAQIEARIKAGRFTYE